MNSPQLLWPTNDVWVSFAPQLQRHVPCPDQAITPGTLAEVLDRAFNAAPTLRHYVLDDQGCIRKHVAVFIDGKLYVHRNDLNIVIASGTKINVIQALSGG